MLFLIVFDPWLETFADAEDGDGGGEPSRTILVLKKSSIIEKVNKEFETIQHYMLKYLHIYRK